MEKKNFQGALSLKRKGPLKGDSRKTRVVKATLIGPLIQKRAFWRYDFLSATSNFQKKREKISLGPRLSMLGMVIVLRKFVIKLVCKKQVENAIIPKVNFAFNCRKK